MVISIILLAIVIIALLIGEVVKLHRNNEYLKGALSEAETEVIRLKKQYKDTIIIN